MFSPLCAKKGVVLPFTLKHLDETNDGFVTLQVSNLSNNFVTFRSIEEVDEVIEDSANWENLSGEDNVHNTSNEDQFTAEEVKVQTCATEDNSTSMEAASQGGSQPSNAEMSDV